MKDGKGKTTATDFLMETQEKEEQPRRQQKNGIREALNSSELEEGSYLNTEEW